MFHLFGGFDAASMLNSFTTYWANIWVWGN